MLVFGKQISKWCIVNSLLLNNLSILLCKLKTEYVKNLKKRGTYLAPQFLFG